MLEHVKNNMKIPTFLKRKSLYIVLSLVVGGGIWIAYARSTSHQVTYETVAVEQRDLVQTVEVTGQLAPSARIELSFKASGPLKTLVVNVGDRVTKDQLLAELKNDDVVFAIRGAKAAVAQAQANLNARLAGETVQSIRVAETQLEQADASYQKAVKDLEATRRTTQDSVKNAELALQTAKNNLDNQEAIVTQNIQNAYDAARIALLAALGPLTTGLTDGDQIIGVDNTAANDAYENVLGVTDPSSVTRAKASYIDAKKLKIDAETVVKMLSAASTKEQIQDASSKIQLTITGVQAFLTDVQKVLAATITSASFSASDLATKKSTIDTDRSAVSTQNTAVLNATQALKNTELTRAQTVAQLQDAYTTALTNASTARTNAESQVRAAESTLTIQKAGRDAAKASLDLKKAPPRAVDIAGLRAAIEQARVNVEKAESDLKNTQIFAPIDGIVSEVIPHIGEQVTQNATVIRMVSTERYDIEANIPEADIAKVETGQSAEITLDAYGDDVKFAGTIVTEDPDQTKIQEAVYYKVHVQIDPAGRDIKPGMTANVVIKTGERKNVLVIPLRAVRTQEETGQKMIRVLIQNQAQERVVELGLRGDEGRVEVLQGIGVGDQVVTGEKTPNGM